jgi:hypothetical protein
MATTIDRCAVDYYLDPVRVSSMVLVASLIIWPNAELRRNNQDDARPHDPRDRRVQRLLRSGGTRRGWAGKD